MARCTQRQANMIAPVKRTVVLTVTVDDPEPAAIARAAQALRQGKLVAFPTETVYGLGANALDRVAVRAIFAAKGRPSDDPLIVHLASPEDLPVVASQMSREARLLATAFWPGPLTLVLPRNARVPLEVTAGLDSVAVRVPDHAIARALISAAAVPVAAPSANRFGHTSPTLAEHVLADLEGRVDLVLDGGPCRVGVESTVVDVSATPPRVLRPGGVSVEDLERVLGLELELGTTPGPARSPGLLARHYSPNAPLELYEGDADQVVEAMARRIRACVASGERVGVLASREDTVRLGLNPPPEGVQVADLGSEADPAGIARRLYSAMRRLDARGPDVILARTYGVQGVGLAIADRLRRAAARRRQVDPKA
jgi:L-threonylcarbamoyladenylate synthase